MSVEKSEPFKLLQMKLEIAKNDAIRELDRAYFGPESFGPVTKKYPPIRWCQRVWWRVRGYVWTLWRALRGDELDTPYDDY